MILDERLRKMKTFKADEWRNFNTVMQLICWKELMQIKIFCFIYECQLLSIRQIKENAVMDLILVFHLELSIRRLNSVY